MNRALLSAIALCFAAGCEQKPAEPPKPKTAQAVVPLPPEAPKAAAASAGQDAKPQQVAGAMSPPAKAAAKASPKRPGTKGCGSGKCVVHIRNVKVGTPFCTADYNAKDLLVAGAQQKITWHVAGGWTFDAKPNGIELPMGSGQFSDPQGGGSAKFSWVDVNDDDKTYKYVVRITKGSQKCVIDPSVLNGAETEDPNYPPP